MNFLGMDIGFGEVKAILANETEVLKSSCFPTLIAEHTPTPFEEDKITFQSKGIEYVLGKDAKKESDCFQLSNFNDMIEFAPLLFKKVVRTEFGLYETDFVVCVGIPPGWWDHRKDLMGILSEEVQHTQYVIVVPQGQGAFVTVQRKKDLGDAETVLVLDFGYNTVDYLLIEIKEDQKFVVTRGDTVPKLGVVKLVKLFKGELKEELSEFPNHVLKEMLRHGYGKLYGEKINLEGYKKKAVRRYCAMLTRKLEDSVGEIWKEVDAVICTGGGVYYFNPEKNLPHHRIVIPSQPEFANAKGQAMWTAYRYLQGTAGARIEG